ncbi:hypothetical protein [Roseomonas populi]|uniref:Uncharacterized protein n=1 Tax=Roseomonas populi TaxID=3121582 RepID=A0ABT1X2H1_9PROT|nr:hypothetical protein [Roseomonas pecuniae]MCR0982287.1 hypothetical protein [Roseomonas pecuniae]
MSRKFALLAAACAFSAIIGAAPGAFAQAQSDMIPPGAPLPGGSTAAPPMSSGAVSPAGRTAVGGSAGYSSGAAVRPMTRSQRQAMRQGRRSASRAQGSDAAYMGGGAVYERGADGTLRPVM